MLFRSIWFTNPVNSGNWDKDSKMEIDHQSVFRLDPQADGKYTITRVTFDTIMPNGILVSQDNHTLYVAESNYTKGVPRELRAYPIKDDGSLGTFTTLFTWGEDAHGIHRGIDGMCLDRDGNIVACAGAKGAGAGPMVYVISPQGAVLESHALPGDLPAKCAFGDSDLSSLYVTTGEGALYRAKATGRRGIKR